MKFCDGLSAAKVDFEIIVIANDPTAAELAFAEKLRPQGWFRFIGVKREPLYASWNRGVGLAKGEFIGFWNADDGRRAEAVIEGIGLFSAGADLVNFPFTVRRYLNIFNLSVFVWYRYIAPPEYERTEFTRSMHCGPFFMFKKSLYNLVGPFDEQFRIVGDFDWCVRAAKVTDKFVLAKKNAGSFRVDGGGLSSGGKSAHTAENNVVYLRHGVTEKILPVAEELMAKYRPDQILHQGVYENIK